MSEKRLSLRTVTHQRLSSDTTWVALGDISLLDSSEFAPLILSRATLPSKIDTEVMRLESLIQAGTILVSGFISFPEKAVVKRLAPLPNLKLIRVLPFTLHNYPLTPFAKQRIDSGSTLILSGFTESDTTLTRTNCIKMNRWILHLCQTSCTTKANITPSSPLASSPQVPAFTPDDDPAAIFL